jgi:hypothetical protein
MGARWKAASRLRATTRARGYDQNRLAAGRAGRGRCSDGGCSSRQPACFSGSVRPLWSSTSGRTAERPRRGPGGPTSARAAAAPTRTRARIAVAALFALDRRETVYYPAATDAQGTALTGDCSYRLEGRDLAARWWSITAYGADNYLIGNEANVYSLSKSTVQRAADGHYIMRVSARKQELNWLPVKAGASFDLTVRLYNPEPSVYERPASVDLPRIVRESCP